MNECPTPWKIAYATRAEAKQYLRERKGRNKKRSPTPLQGQLTPYPCPAGGHWHLTHMAAADWKRLKRKLKLGRASL